MYTAYRFPSAPAAASKAGGTSTWAHRNAAASSSVSTSSSAASSRAASPAHGRLSREKDLDRALKTAPKGGKVYIKEREDQLDQQWGGAAAARTASSRSSSGQRPPAPPVPVAPTPFNSAASSAGQSRSAVSAQPQNKGKAKATQGAAASEAETELSEEGAVELLRIERALRGFEPRKESQRRSCFCQGELPVLAHSRGRRRSGRAPGALSLQCAGARADKRAYKSLQPASTRSQATPLFAHGAPSSSASSTFLRLPALLAHTRHSCPPPRLRPISLPSNRLGKTSSRARNGACNSPKSKRSANAPRSAFPILQLRRPEGRFRAG